MRPAIRMLVLPIAVLAAACDGGGGTEPDRLTPADVAGVYQMCRLRFTPSQSALPVADVLVSVIDSTPPAGKPEPTLTFSGVAAEFELVYTRQSDSFLQQVRGDVEFGSGSVFLYITSQIPSNIPQEALLPSGHLDLVFNAATGRLTAGSEVGTYWVRRSDYTRAAGISPEGLQERIYGHISAEFAAGAC
ncbi:MAG TPA: hypothetical protein VEW03_07415 [Longimicrobiaceae bacterium]|nr:hypothetical protein [Longimicrobiaceae bacterium]